MLTFGHFGLKIRPLWFWNLTRNLWDYETRAQELTSGAIRMLSACYRFLLRFERFSKMEWYEGYFTHWIWWLILTFFTIFDISPLWMEKFGWNWWPNWRVFYALAESGKIFDRYDPQNFWETLEAGAKKWFFSPFWLLWSKNLGTSEIENDKRISGQIKLLFKI